MTINDVATCGKDFLTCADVAGLLGCKPQSLREQVKEDRTRLGFPVVVIGSRIRIPTEGFLNYCKGSHIFNKEEL